MNAKAGGWILLGLTVFVGIARTDEPYLVLPALVLDNDAIQDAAGKDKTKQPDDKKKPAEPPKTDFFPVDSAIGNFPTFFNPNMMGDFPGSFARQRFTVFGAITTTNTTVIRDAETGVIVATKTTVTVPTSQTRTILVPVSSGGAFKVADNESPRPQDRVFFTYNYFGNLHGPQIGPNDAVNTAQTSNTSINGPGGPSASSTTISTFIPPAPNVNTNLNREIFGFEKTFLDGRASIEMRVPLLQQASNVDGFSSRDIGDLTIVGRYAFLLDQETGNVFTAGLAVTAPTGPSIVTIDGNLHSTLLQPWIGYIWNSERFFVHAFHSVVVPTDARDVTLLFNDVGVNYWLYRGESDRPLSFIVPMLEAHVTTPLNHRDGNGPIFIPDLVILTGGAHIGLGRSATLSFGVATPVTGPRVFSIEGFAQFNWRF